MIFCKKTSFNEQEGPSAPGAPSGGVGLLVLALLLVLLLLLHRRRREAVYDLHDDDGDIGFEQRRDLLAAAVGRRLRFGLLLQHVHFGEQPHDRLADLAATGHAQRHRDLVIPLPFEAPEQQQVMLRMVTLRQSPFLFPGFSCNNGRCRLKNFHKLGIQSFVQRVFSVGSCSIGPSAKGIFQNVIFKTL